MIRKLKDVFQTRIANRECMCCILKPLIFMTYLFLPLDGVCLHSSNQISYFVLKRYKVILSLLFQLVIISPIYYLYIILLMKYCSLGDKGCFLILLESIYGFGGFLFVVAGAWKLNYLKRFLNGLIAFTHKENNKVRDLHLTDKTIRNLNFFIKLHRFGTMLLLIAGGLMFYYVDDGLQFRHIRQTIGLLSMYYEFTSTIEISMYVLILSGIFKCLCSGIKLALLPNNSSTCVDINKVPSPRIIPSNPNNDEFRSPLCKNLEHYGYAFDAFRTNFDLLNEFFYLPVILWFLLVVVVLILNLYLIVQVYKDELVVLIELEIGTLFYIITLVYVVVRAETFNNMNEDILSFLFKYPISKLSRAEAAQVEMLITTLSIQKPVLRASDIFTVGTRLLASISGTVITYVLVALQFHASWAK